MGTLFLETRTKSKSSPGNESRTRTSSSASKSTILARLRGLTLQKQTGGHVAPYPRSLPQIPKFSNAAPPDCRPATFLQDKWTATSAAKHVSFEESHDKNQVCWAHAPVGVRPLRRITEVK